MANSWNEYFEYRIGFKSKDGYQLKCGILILRIFIKVIYTDAFLATIFRLFKSLRLSNILNEKIPAIKRINPALMNATKWVLNFSYAQPPKKVLIVAPI